MENLKEKTAKGLFWGAMSSGMTQVLNLVFGIFLARLLAPSEYGIVGVLTIFSAVAGAIQSGGFGAGLINIKRPTNNDYNSVFWLNISVSLTLYIMLFLCAPLIASFFKQPCLVLVSRVVFLSLPISAVALVSGTYLAKNMMNRELAIISVMALVISGITGVSLAFMGFSYWSLVWQQLAYVIVSDIGRFYFAPWRPSLHIDFTPVKKMFSFCIKLTLTGIINTLNQNILTFVFGRLFTISSVGNYSQANKWNSMAYSTITSSIGQLAQTVFVAASDEDKREIRVFRKMIRFTAFISFPALFGLAMVSREFILITIGEKWIDSILLLQLLCIGGAFMPLYTLYQNIAISHGRSDLVQPGPNYYTTIHGSDIIPARNSHYYLRIFRFNNIVAFCLANYWTPTDWHTLHRHAQGHHSVCCHQRSCHGDNMVCHLVHQQYLPAACLPGARGCRTLHAGHENAQGENHGRMY